AVDHRTGATTTHYAGDHASVAEPLFVPAHDDAAEGEGYVLAVVGRLTENRSDLLILDARDVSAPPVATLRFPLRIPYGLHGNWLSAAELAHRAD
ncbi:carotenoid oxygenase family protein, partial [Streptomyces spiralis]